LKISGKHFLRFKRKTPFCYSEDERQETQAMQFFLNDSFLSQSDALLPILDLGLLRGYAVFDYLRTYNKKPFHLQDHLERLHYSAKETSLSIPYDFATLTSIIVELIERSKGDELSIKLIVTGGQSPDQLIPSLKSSFIAFTYPLTPPKREYFTHGIKTITNSHQRILPYCKTTNYLPAILSLLEGQKTGAVESLYLNKKKEILEATTSNFFAIKQGTLLTPPEGEILLGITRSVLLHICQEKLPVSIEPISYADMGSLDEAFITSSNKEVMPVTHIDDHPIGTGKVGPYTKKIMKAFQDYTLSQDWPHLRIERHAPTLISV
jgi:branched-chain amino acid aminotransferase